MKVQSECVSGDVGYGDIRLCGEMKMWWAVVVEQYGLRGTPVEYFVIVEKQFDGLTIAHPAPRLLDVVKSTLDIDGQGLECSRERHRPN